jgi:hypothetical protein
MVNPAQLGSYEVGTALVRENVQEAAFWRVLISDQEIEECFPLV